MDTLTTILIIVGSILVIPLVVGAIFTYKWKSWRCGLFTVVCIALIILNLSFGIKNHSEEGAAAVDIVAVILGIIGVITDQCLKACDR